MKITIATCQFPTSSDARHNARWVRRQMRHARDRGAIVAHFPEGALSGYAPHDLPSYAGYDWRVVREEALQISDLAGRLGLWVILGAAHPLSGDRKPHNSVYVISADGELVDRYDKRFCAGDGSPSGGELGHYTPGSHVSLFAIAGVRCGTTICHECRYPELFREYKRLGAELVFHSFHAGNVSPDKFGEMQEQVGRSLQRLNNGSTLPEIAMTAAIRAAAADNYLWISCSNSSARESCFAAFAVRPDGVIVGRLKRNVPGVLISEIDTGAEHYDSTRAWRERAMTGRLHSGTLVDDPRSRDRRSL